MIMNIKGFLHRRRGLFFTNLVIAMCLSTGLIGADDNAIQFMFNSSNTLKITERSNIRVSENSKYIGLTYNESRGILSYMYFEDGYSKYTGNYYIYEASLQDTRLKANLVDSNEYCEIDISDQGRYRISDEQFVPVLRDFPVFPDKEISPGYSWRDFGVRLVDPDNSGNYTYVKFYCEYLYEGLKDTSLGKKHIITSRYAMRYKPGDSKIYDPSLKQITGSHLVTIMIDDADRSSIFIRDQLEEQYLYFSGRLIEHSGFILTWYNDVIGMDRARVAEKTASGIAAAELEGVDVVEKAEGIALSIRNLHFVPDSAEILPDERGRINSIYKVLSGLEFQKILVVGHTADIGSRESQYELSEQRAKTVIDKLVESGMQPSIFIYEGRGGDEPAASNDTDEGRAMNRRVELIIIE